MSRQRKLSSAAFLGRGYGHRLLVQVNVAETKPHDLDSTQAELSHRFPSFLPDGRHFMFIVQASRSLQAKADKVYVGSIDSADAALDNIDE